MDPHTLLTVGFVVLVAGTLFVTARIGAVAIGVLPSTPGVDDAGGDATSPDADDSSTAGGQPAGEADGLSSSDDASVDSASVDGEDADRWGRSRITADDLDRIRRHLEKDRVHRCPDDLRPSDDEGS